MTPRLLLLLTLLALSIGCCLLVAITVVAKIRRSQRSRTLARLAAPHRRLILEVASGEDDGAAQTLAALGRREWGSIRRAVIAMLGRVRGVPAEQLVRVLAAHGEIGRARAKLHARSSLERARGAHLLGLARDETSVPRLLELLTDPADDVRLVACRSLGQIGDAVAAAAVLEAVPGAGSRKGVPAWVAAESLLAMGPGARDALLEALAHPDPRTREVAVTVITHSSLPATIDALRSRLGSEPQEEILVAMITALGLLGESEDCEPLLGYTAPDHPTPLRLAATRALGDLGDCRAAPRLGELLDDCDRQLAGHAAQALTQLGPTGIELLHTARA